MAVLLVSCFALLYVMAFTSAQEWTVDLKYSLGEKDFIPFGNILIRKHIDGNYSGDFIACSSTNDILTSLINEAANSTDVIYKMRVGSAFSLNSLKAFSQSNFGHLIELTIEQETRKILSVTHFPNPVKSPSGEFRVEVRVKRTREINGPDTTSYLHRIEEEKRARQHGATQDNRSFLQKYWMYFVPVILFMVLSNAFNADNQGQE